MSILSLPSGIMGHRQSETTLVIDIGVLYAYTLESWEAWHRTRWDD
jgi:hypothetical protein